MRGQLSDVWGRDAELAVLDAFLDAAGTGPGVLVIEGEPGIGKTTLWRHAVRSAGLRGVRVLSCRPAPAEARLTYAGLGDLLDPVADTVLADLPQPQRHALEAGLLRATPVVATEQRIVATAFLSVLRHLATAAPVLVAVDDLQWMDEASWRVVEFASRRLAGEPVGLLVAGRLAELDARRSAVLATQPGRARVIRPGRLAQPAIRRILAARLGHDFARPALARITTTAAGNPLFAIELGRALLEPGADLPGSPQLPLPPDVSTLLLRRLRRLPAASQRELLVAAAVSQPTVSALDRSALGPAERAGIVAIDRSGRVSFTHPLLASAVYTTAPAWQVRQVHRAVAERARDPEERARHLALSEEGPNEEIAAALTAAADLASQRGAPSAAADLLALAIAITPAECAGARRARTVAAAESHCHAGDRTRARALAADVVEHAPPGPLTGRSLRLLGLIHYYEDSCSAAIRLFERAAEHLCDDPLGVDLSVNLAHILVSLGDFTAAAAQAAAAVAAARRFDDKPLVASAMAVAALTDLFTGRPADWDRVEDALLLEDPDQQGPIQVRPTWIAGAMRLYGEQLDPARVHLVGLRQRMIDRGEDSELPFLAFHLAMLERLAGDLPAALRYADEGCDVAEQLASPNLMLVSIAERCFARTLANDVTGAQADAERGLALATQTSYPAGTAWMRAAAGFLRLSLGELAEAASVLEPIMRPVERSGFCHPVLALAVPDAIEAFIAVGWLDRAERLLDPVSQAGTVGQRPSLLMNAGRCRALVYAAQHDLAAASACVDEALWRYGGDCLPFDRARTLLVQGQIRRRTRKKLAARQVLADAVASFEQLGAGLWADRARAELARVGVRAATGRDLTATEERVAVLAAAGLTNREIAERGFLSPKTVEANLVRIYHKLGIRSRAELGARMRDRQSSREA